MEPGSRESRPPSGSRAGSCAWSARRDRRSCTGGSWADRAKNGRRRTEDGRFLYIRPPFSVFRPQLAQQSQLGLEIYVMRQLQMLDEAVRLDVVGMREHELLVLRRPLALLGELVGAQRAIDQRHRHRLALALAEHEAVAAREAWRAAVATGELIDHLAFGDGNLAERNCEGEVFDEQLDLDLAEADFADERMGAAVAPLGRIGEPEQEPFVAARQILQPCVASRG